MQARISPTAPADYHCSFARGGWDPADWLMVKEPRFPRVGAWLQEDACIRNCVPADAAPDDLIETGRRANETFTTMLLKDRLYGDAVMRSTVSFEHRMAPLLILRAGLGAAPDGTPETRDMINVVLFDQGLRVWHYRHADYTAGRPAWRLAAFSRFPLTPNTPYALEVRMKQDCLEARVDDRHLGLTDPTLPARGYVGLCGCEGVTRFYDVSVNAL